MEPRAPLAWLAATGNRFAVLDATGGIGATANGTNDAIGVPPPADPARLAVAAARASTPRADGLLLVLPPRAGGDVRMQVVNADGSAAEACGNGLRCVARLAVERGYAGPELVVETDAGPRRVVAELARGTVVAARAELGRARSVELGVRLALASGGITADLVDLGNPHCVLLVGDVDAEDLARLGPELERHPRFPRRTNVELAQVVPGGAGDPGGPGRLRVRIWERGVGETGSCGTGAAAAALAALARGLVATPVEVVTRGGSLCVERAGDGVVWLSGTVEPWAPRLLDPAPELARLLAPAPPLAGRPAT